MKNSTTTLQIFDFNSNALRIVTDNNGETWFIAKDIADILGYADTQAMTRRLDDDEIKKANLQNIGLHNNQTLVNESGLYASILGSNKPEAKLFKKHVTSEILPAIRKTGGYLAKEQPRLQSVAKEYKGALALAKLVGYKDNQAHLTANKMVLKATGYNVHAEMNLQLEAPVQSRLITPTDLGLLINLSGIKVNQLLKDKGYQTDRRDSKGKIIWTPTEKGVKFSRLHDTDKKHGDGTPVQQVKWYESIVKELGL